MSEIAIRARGLSKMYRIGQRERENALRNVLGPILRAPWKLLKREKNETFWALKGVDLEVKRGDVLGLIGRNGAGKTTLLKILSRITKPTSGWAEIYGHVGTLLEVGTGFHPELSGRENTFLSGAILGMSKREINRKFDEIVAFAELEKFIDTPVKHYSSGMYVRLAFAVAAYLEPEILFVDEVLAVGDINFQKKCLGKMGDVARAGRTVVLVSHQLNQIRRLCHRVVWIDGGVIRGQGSTADVVGDYEADARAMGEDARPNGGRAKFLRWEIVDAKKDQANVLDWDGEVRLKFVARVNERLSKIHHGIALYNQAREVLWGNGIDELTLEPGIHELITALPSLPLQPGVYSWRVSLYDGGRPIDDWDCVPPMFVSTVPQTHRQDEFRGVLNIPSEFTIQPLSVPQEQAGR